MRTTDINQRRAALPKCINPTSVYKDSRKLARKFKLATEFIKECIPDKFGEKKISVTVRVSLDDIVKSTKYNANISMWYDGNQPSGVKRTRYWLTPLKAIIKDYGNSMVTGYYMLNPEVIVLELIPA